MDNKEKTEELLCEVYRNVKMGGESLCSVTGKVKDKFMLSEITRQIDEYSRFANNCENMMSTISVKPKEPSKMKKLMTKGGIAVNTVLDSSDGHIADMIVKGTNLGASELEKTLTLCRYSGSSAGAVVLSEQVVAFEREAAGRMKDFT